MVVKQASNHLDNHPDSGTTIIQRLKAVSLWFRNAVRNLFF